MAFSGVQDGFELAHELQFSLLVGHKRLSNLLGLIHLDLCKLLFRQEGPIAVSADDMHLAVVDALELPLVGQVCS